jgi:hypothetical protein
MQQIDSTAKRSLNVSAYWIISSSGGRATRRKRGRRSQDLDRPPQLSVFTLETFELRVLFAGHPGTGTGINFGTVTSFAQHLWADAQLGTDLADRRIFGLVLGQRFLKDPQRAAGTPAGTDGA